MDCDLNDNPIYDETIVNMSIEIVSFEWNAYDESIFP